MTTGIIVGKGISGPPSESLIKSFSGTGAAGKRANIGKSKRPGVSKA
jgi:hypothetical protein